jgi:hypothetical protein
MHIGYLRPEVVAVANKPAETRERETPRASAETLDPRPATRAVLHR